MRAVGVFFHVSAECIEQSASENSLDPAFSYPVLSSEHEACSAVVVDARVYDFGIGHGIFENSCVVGGVVVVLVVGVYPADIHSESEIVGNEVFAGERDSRLQGVESRIVGLASYIAEGVVDSAVEQVPEKVHQWIGTDGYSEVSGFRGVLLLLIAVLGGQGKGRK